MSSIRLATAGNVRGFQTLSNALNDSDGKWAHLIDYEGLQDEIGRFRVWSGNLGALQKGHSSLDYRLRDSPLLSSNALKFLKDLEDNLNEAVAIVTEARLPYESQPKPEKTEGDEEDDDDDFFDEDEDEDDDGEPRSELSMRFAEVVDIIDNLYKLSVRIRTPTIRSRSLKAATYQPKDPETGVDILSTYAGYDVQHVKELLAHLRHVHVQDEQSTEYDYLINRLSAAITLRRRQFKYWKRHRDKLGASNIQEEHVTANQPPADRPGLPQRNDTLEALPDIPTVTIDKIAPSQKTGKTLLSGTEATQHHQSLDEIVDTKSVTSYAVTVKDLHGRGVELPPPPRAADGEKDFECPYCYIICPARYGRGRAWRTHLLQDLQPYVCTYSECESFEQLFRSRREWAEHEASHRKAWRCPEHTDAVYKSSAALEAHFRREHADTIPESQLSAIVKVGETTTVDVRTQCPICLVPADTEGLGDFHNHIANHLERIATFALPNGNEDESDGASSAASRGRSESSQSRNLSDLSLPTDASEDMATTVEGFADHGEEVSKIEMHRAEDITPQTTSGTLLSAESLGQLPDASEARLQTLLKGSTVKNDNSIGALDSDTDSSVYLGSDSDDDVEDEGARPRLQVADIPTLRSLYRSRRLLQRDQSFNPNDAYNQIISLVHHDLTRIEVDAIINGANRAMKVTGGETLNNAIHRAAGPDLARETKTKGRLSKEAILTGGHRLPSKHIIHVLRPGYSHKSGIGQFNQLVDCYRNAFNTAVKFELKTLAFPCLGTGGVGFPARVAARIVLQDVREYLDQHRDYKFERIVFCVNSAADEMAYIDFLPVFFPPTHDDLEVARSSVWAGDRATAAQDALKARNEIQKVVSDLNLCFGNSVPNFQIDIIIRFNEIDHALVSIRQYLLSSNEVNLDMKDLRLLCTVMQLICGNIAETVELATDHRNLGQQNDLAIWGDYVSTVQDMHGKGPSWLLEAFNSFAQGLKDIITKNSVAVDDSADLTELRLRLDRYKVKQRGGRDAHGTQDHFDEVLYTREFQRQTIAQSREHVKLHKIPTVTQLYKLGELEEKTTLARPSIDFNDKVCLVREDITKLEVDVMVNSADEAFEGAGTLARTVFNKGGAQLQEAVQTFGKCQAGDVRLTPGYLLPAKNILHVIPPDQLRQDTKDIMRKIYREVLYNAVTLGAASIALPSIGTGMLNFPRRDCVSIALEETKRFLESSIPGSLIEKIVFVVYSSNDEFVYKSLLPVYFPPPDLNVNRALPASIARQDTAATTSSSSSDKPRRNLFGSIGEAFRSLRPGKPSGASRSISGNEEHALINFESHAKDCETCRNVEKLYLEGRDLCKMGDELAKIVLWHMTMYSDSEVYAFPPVQGVSTRLEVPTDMFPISLDMLATVEKSQREGDGSRPFVARDRPYGATSRDQGQDVVPPGVTIHSGEVQLTKEHEPKRARAYVLTLNHVGQWDHAASRECQILVHPSSVDVFEYGIEGDSQVPLMSNLFTSQSRVQRRKTTPEVELYGCPRLESRTYTAEAILFRCRSDNECNALLRSIRTALDDFKAAASSAEQQQVPAASAVAEQDTSKEYGAWNQRLKEIQKELSFVSQTRGGLSNLQSKMERLGAATANLNPGAQQDTDASHLYDTSRSPLATRVLVLLTADLKSRPGSYIGLKTDRIVTELSATHDEVSSALQELVEQDQVHNTVDGETWVISHPPKDLPVLPEDRVSQDQAISEASAIVQAEDAEDDFKSLTENVSARGRGYYTCPHGHACQEGGVQSDGELVVFERNSAFRAHLLKHERPYKCDRPGCTNTKGFARRDQLERHKATAPHPVPVEASPSAAQTVLKPLASLNEGSEEKEQRDNGQLSGAMEAATEESALSLSPIAPSPTASDDGKRDEGVVAARTTEPGDDLVVGDMSSLNLMTPSSLGPERFPDSAYESSPSGTIWTRIAKTMAYSKVLIAAGEVFDDMGEYWLVHREVSKQDVDQWLASGLAMLPSERTEWDKEQRKGEFRTLGKQVDEAAENNAGKDNKQKQPQIAIRDASELSDGLPSPTIPPPSSLSNDDIRRLGDDRLPDFDYFISLSGQAWTRVKKRHVASQILVAAHETFDDAGAHYLVYRAVGKSELLQWVLATHRLEGREKEKWVEEQKMDTTYEEESPPAARTLLAEDADILRLGDDRLPDSDYYIWPRGIIWTRVEKSRVYSGTLIAAKEEFSDLGFEFLVQRVAGKSELDRWAEETNSMVQAEKDKWAEERKKAQENEERLDVEVPEPPSALLDHPEVLPLGDDRLSGSEYYESPAGSIWTRVKKIYVYSGVLEAANEEFADSGSELLVYRAVGKSDMQRWIEETQNMPEAEKEKWEEEQRQAREAMQMASGELYESFKKAWDVQPGGSHISDRELVSQQDDPVTIREASEFGELPPSPTIPHPAPPLNQIQFDPRTLSQEVWIISPSGARWTRVRKDMIDPRVLVAANEEFDEVKDAYIVHRVLRRGELMKWSQESIQLRERDEGKGKKKEHDDGAESAQAAEVQKSADKPQDSSYTPRGPVMMYSLATQPSSSTSSRSRRQSVAGKAQPAKRDPTPPIITDEEPGSLTEISSKSSDATRPNISVARRKPLHVDYPVPGQEDEASDSESTESEEEEEEEYGPIMRDQTRRRPPLAHARSSQVVERPESDRSSQPESEAKREGNPAFALTAEEYIQSIRDKGKGKEVEPEKDDPSINELYQRSDPNPRADRPGPSSSSRQKPGYTGRDGAIVEPARTLRRSNSETRRVRRAPGDPGYRPSVPSGPASTILPERGPRPAGAAYHTKPSSTSRPDPQYIAEASGSHAGSRRDPSERPESVARSSSWAGRRRRAPVVVVQEASAQSGEGSKNEEKGIEREKDDRDEHQEKLDRVIAGDMREEELRRFGDGDEERYI